MNGAFALSGPQITALALSALWIGIAILSLVVATPERISRRIVGTRSEGSFRKLASWASQANPGVGLPSAKELWESALAQLVPERRTFAELFDRSFREARDGEKERHEREREERSEREQPPRA